MQLDVVSQDRDVAEGAVHTRPAADARVPADDTVLHARVGVDRDTVENHSVGDAHSLRDADALADGHVGPNLGGCRNLRCWINCNMPNNLI